MRHQTVALFVLALAVGCAKRDQAATDSAAGTAAAPPAGAASATGASATAGGTAGAANSMAMLDVGRLPGGAEYVTDTEGRAVYLFEKDRKDSSTCTEACAGAWPPVMSSNTPMAHNNAIDAAKLGTIMRADGKRQATYGGKPLYYYAQDKARGDIKGQDVKEFGAEWYLLKPNGEKQEAKK